MAKNTIADLDTTASNNTDVLGQSTSGTAAVSTIDTMIQNSLGLLARFYADIGGLGTVGGTADAITLTTASTYQALENGITLAFKAGSSITGASTINVDGLGAKAIRRLGDSATQAGDIVANGVYLLRYDTAYNSAAGAWIVLNSGGASAATTSAAGIVELATAAEAFQASSSTLAVTPAGLANLYSIAVNNAIEIADLKGSRLNMAGGIADAYDSETDVDTATSTNEIYDATNDLYSPAPSPIAVSTTAAATNTSSSTTHNMGTLSIGSAATDRDVIVTGNTRWGSTATVSGVTIGGNAATLDVNSSGANVSSWIARLRVTTGTTAEIIVTSATTMTHTGIQVYRMTGATSGVTATDNSTSTATPVTLTQNVPAGGAAFGCQIEDSANVTGLAFTAGLTEDLEQELSASNFVRGAHGSLTTSTALTSQSFTATRSGTRGSANNRYSLAIYSPSSVANMTLASNAFTATAVPTVARIAAFIDPQVSMTINTDFTAEASRDGGTTYTAVTLAAVSNPVGTVEQYEGSVAISSQPSGTSMKYRLKTLNNKDIDVTGVVFQWS